MVQRHKKLIQLRNLCYEERAWRAQLNYSLSKAHLVVLYQGFEQLHGGDLQHRFIPKISPTLFCILWVFFLGTIDHYISKWPACSLLSVVVVYNVKYMKYKSFYLHCIYKGVYLFVLWFRYSQFSPLCFSLAYSGLLVWRSIQRQQPSKYEVVSERDEANCLREYPTTLKERGQNEGEENSML